ncbi:MAG: hypothetical protein ICV53_09850 [Flavisolibacter sp.]|nr:hypothetical protein [Flavisolibacter sp.]
MHDLLFYYWQTFTGKYGSDEELSDHLFLAIKSAYNEPHRFYHTISHIQHLIHLFNNFEASLSDKELVFFSISYHDIVFIPGRNDNEEKSARRAERDLRLLNIPEEKTENIKSFIRATKDHLRSGATNNDDLSFFLDFDRSILGAEESKYAAYVKAIRHEFSFLSEHEFAKGRASFLKRTLANPFVFYTVPFRQAYEQRAQKNMEQELHQWLRYT